MKSFLYLLVFIAIAGYSNGQGGPSVWRFGDPDGVTFIPGASLPVADTPATSFWTNAGSGVVCNSAGQLLFFSNGYWIYDRNGDRMPSFSGLQPYSPIMNYTGGTVAQNSLIVPFARDTNQFFVFSLSTIGQLYYSVVDMTLNNGLGDVVPGRKSIPLGYNFTEKMTAVAGCNNIWVVVRSMNSNSYSAYSVTDTGIMTTPVVSTAGNLPVAKYRFGVIKFSPDGRKMAAGCYKYNEFGEPSNPLHGGVELYDFDKFSGTLHNAVLLDTTRPYYGACFSADGSKLYASAMEEKDVYQWDLLQPNTPALLASQTMVLANPNYWVFNISCWCWVVSIPELGDLQRGPDGKIYIGNNISDQWIQIGPNNYSGLSSFLHVIHQPNLPGVLCQPQVNAVHLPQATRMGLPNDIVYFPKQDTTGTTFTVIACFQDSITITADTGKEYRWQDGYTERTRTIRQPGSYSVRYTGIDCALHFDTFIVSFPKLPVAGANGFSCPGANSGRLSVKQAAGDSTRYMFSWKDAAGNVMKTVLSNIGDTITGLDTGSYFLQLTTTSGCDTTLSFYVQPLPVPGISFDADSIGCAGEALRFANTGAGIAWDWHFGDGDSAAGAQAVHRYEQTGFYTVTLTAMNAEGCAHTLSKDVEVKDFTISLTASEDLVNKNTVVWLTTHAAAPYEVLAWQPQALFAQQEEKQQQVQASDSRTYTVMAQSEYGCRDTASVEVRVRSVIFLPSAFTPNGDGTNDLFHPVISGEPVKVRYFQVYDRWGKMVWKAGSNDPAEGWDGTCQGTAAAAGTYYYFINIETGSGETFQQKGDVSLVR